MKQPLLVNSIKWIMILIMPWVLGFGVVTAVIAWDYPAFEYPRIESDRYGWTDEQRYELGKATLDYIQSPLPVDEAIVQLEELRLPEDPEKPLYNEREIKHMVDVKVLFDQIQRLFWFLLVVTILCLIYFFAQPDLRIAGADGIFKGGIATVILLTGIGAFIGIGWSLFFVYFHELLFPPGTWTFYYTDSLIRLFPEKFWFDIGVIISVTALIDGIIVAIIGYYLRRYIAVAMVAMNRS